MKYKNIDLAALAFYNVSEDAAKSFIDWRASLKKPMTQRAFNLCLKEAVLCGQLGLTPDEALDKTQLWGWQAPNYAYAAKKIGEEFNSMALTMRPMREIKTTRETSVIEDLRDRSWAN